MQLNHEIKTFGNLDAIWKTPDTADKRVVILNFTTEGF